MGNTIGEKYKITVFGQSHSPAMGVVIDGLPAGIDIPFEYIKKQLFRRRPSKKIYSTAREETDLVNFISGIVDNKTCGAPICGIIKNLNHKPCDYDELRKHPRPGHADYPAYIKYAGNNDISGGGQFSGRLTAPLTIAGALAESILNKKGIYIVARIKQIHDICDDSVDIDKVKYDDLVNLRESEFPVVNDNLAIKMQELIKKFKNNGDSVGGIVECFVFGLPAGLGNPLYNSVESEISKMIFSIPGVRGIEFGRGFDAINLTGSEHNDEYYYDETSIKTKTNNHGGVLGGMTTGMPIVFRVAFKPTSSIAKQQLTVDLENKENYKLEINGRHDACFVPRALVALEMATAITILDLYMQGENI